VKHLNNEGITQDVINVGDVMYDSVLHFTELAEERSQILETHSLTPREFIFVTCHRAENTNDPSCLQEILEALDEIAKDIRVLLPIHPRTRSKMKEFGLNLERVTTIEPVSYLDMLILEKYAKAILTDSGGIQKEAFIFRVPCVTLRYDTEWDETVEAGWNQLVGSSKEKILEAARLAKAGHAEPDFLGDGHAAEYIVEKLLLTTNNGVLT